MTTALARRLGAACLTAACLLGSAAAQTPQALKIIVPYPFTKRTGKSMKSTVYPDHPRASASFAYRHLLH